MKRFFRKYHTEWIAAGFLLPNVLGFLAFTLVPMLLSFAFAFTNWDIQLHNIYKSNPLEWTGLENFRRLLEHPRFWQYLGNTLFLMMGIPFSIAGSLGAALLLSKKLGNPTGRWIGLGLACSLMTAAATVLVVLGMGLSTIWILVGLLLSVVMMCGFAGGTTVYRTLFYTPHFTAGVATFILWKKLYNTHNGPINTALDPVLDGLSGIFNFLPPVMGPVLLWLGVGLAVVVVRYNLRRLSSAWNDADIGTTGLIISLGITILPSILCMVWFNSHWVLWLVILIVFGILVLEGLVPVLRRSVKQKVPATYHLGENMMFSTGLMVLQLVLVGVSLVFYRLPEWSSDGLDPPLWLIDYHWAKPALMIMALWASIGSNNMILYLAGLSNVSPELYDAADIDGASASQRFWYVTWPQLAPVTFFVVVMSIIHGLQGGFEMARTMTEGGPAGATTTLSYFVYIEGFQTGRLGFACAVAWTLFAMIFLLTALNVKFGNRYVND